MSDGDLGDVEQPIVVRHLHAAYDFEQAALLAIPDYDSLSASQVVPRLAGLTTEELEAVRLLRGVAPRPSHDPRASRPAAAERLMESARPATTDDVAQIAELVACAVAELTVTKGGALWARREARRAPYVESICADLAAPDRHVLVGEILGAIVGYAVVRAEPLRDGGVLGVVDDIYVEPEARGVGVGEALMDGIEAWCRVHECIGIDGLALPGNRETKNFFERFGLVARAIIVHRPLDGADSVDGEGS